ncbi:Structural maintenance of chromosomes protein 6 [Pseudolycoriella hygida]|uniref:Structural maintenance of chromosomes protein 6 n=1 Tax=Pseudolycoriella hygida TaxID=35572 RepID=A0A9Q0MPD3_9DIPT|nr:Structural maintenance of chromosomes protein 6 [Pseudolycoriella hygida]
MSRKRQNVDKLSTVSTKRRNIQNEESDDDENSGACVSLVNRSGKINKINLKNFMCHSDLIIEFNKNTNLIIGNNGSGKSAVLTALIVGLGSKGSATNRCTNLAQLIKHGERSASVIIYIENGCDQSYEREVYGPEIIVQRTFTVDGSSSYRIKKSTGQVVSTSRKDLMKILLFLNIQVDNPVCVLTQDASREFLKESDPKKRFKFFLKATQIDTVIEKLNDCSIHYLSSKKQLEYMKTVATSLKEEVEKLQSKFSSLQSVKVLKKNLVTYKTELAWLKVENEESLHKDIMETLTKFQKIYDDLMDTINNRSRREADRSARCQLLNEQIDELKNEVVVHEAKKDEILREISQCQESKNEVFRKYRKMQCKTEGIRKNIQQLESDMAESSESFSQLGRVAKEKEANEKILNSLNERKVECESIRSNNLRDIELMRNSKIQLEESSSELREKRQTLLRNKDKINAEVRRCEATKNSLALYGDFMPELVELIEKAFRKGDFHQLPRGPLGKYIEVVDEKFKGPVEAILREKLRSFCVSDVHDREVLGRILTKISIRYPMAKKLSIIHKKFTDHVYDVSSGKVQSTSNTFCALDLIRCSDPIVMNIIIDFCKIESTLIAEDADTAFHLCLNEENVPKNLLKIIVLDPPTEMFPSPDLRTYSIRKMVPRFLQVDMKQRKEYLMSELSELNARIKELNEEIYSEEAKKENFVKALNEKVTVDGHLEDKLRTMIRKINELEKIEYPGENERKMLLEELNELQGRLVQEEKNCSVEKQQLDKMEAVITEKENAIDSVYNDIEKIDDKINQKKMEIYTENDSALEEAASIAASKRKAAKIKNDLEQMEVEEQSCSKKLASLTASANKLTERISVTNSHDYLAAKIKETEQIIKTVSESAESMEEVEEALKIKTIEFNDKKELVDNLEATLAKLKSSRQNRYQWLIKFKGHVSLRVQHEFNKIMKLRGFDGTISIDHKNETLELSVVPRDKHIENSVSSANCLSGGERSFSTVAFLLALWSVVDSPFYFLDEYDVYTDSVNRYYMTRLLLGEAKRKTHRQYTFLTPQDMSEIVAGNDLSIQRMADPVRK